MSGITVLYVRFDGTNKGSKPVALVEEIEILHVYTSYVVAR